MSETIHQSNALGPRLPFPPVVLGIAGCSGSGKTTLAAELARELGGTHFPLDHYYRDLAHLPVAERYQQNFDDPELIERPLLAAHVAALARGEAIERPLYDFSTHTRVPAARRQSARGLFCWWRGCLRSTIRNCCLSMICVCTWMRQTSCVLIGGCGGTSSSGEGRRSQCGGSMRRRYGQRACTMCGPRRPTPI